MDLTIPLAKVFDTVFHKPTPGSQTVEVIVYRRPKAPDGTPFFDDLYATVGPTARHMKDGAGDSSQ